MEIVLIVFYISCYILICNVTRSWERTNQSHGGSATLFFGYNDSYYAFAMNTTILIEWYECLISNQTKSCTASYTNESFLFKINDIKQDLLEETRPSKPFYQCSNNFETHNFFFICEIISYDTCNLSHANSSTYFRNISLNNDSCIGLFFSSSHEGLSFSNVKDFELCSRDQSEIPCNSKLGFSLRSSVPTTTTSFTAAKQPISEDGNTSLPIILGVTGAVLLLIVVAVVLFIWKRKRLSPKSKRTVPRTQTDTRDRLVKYLGINGDNARKLPVDETHTYKNEEVFDNTGNVDDVITTERARNVNLQSSDRVTVPTSNTDTTPGSAQNDTFDEKEKHTISGSGYEPFTLRVTQDINTLSHSQDILQKYENLSSESDKVNTVQGILKYDYAQVHHILQPDTVPEPQTHDYANIDRKNSSNELSNNLIKDDQKVKEVLPNKDKTLDGTKQLYSNFRQDGRKSLNPYNILKNGVQLGEDDMPSDGVQETNNFDQLSNEAGKMNTLEIVELQLLEDNGCSKDGQVEEYATIHDTLETNEDIRSEHQRTSGRDLENTSVKSPRPDFEYSLVPGSTNNNSNIYLDTDIKASETFATMVNNDYAVVQKRVNCQIDD